MFYLFFMVTEQHMVVCVGWCEVNQLQYTDEGNINNKGSARGTATLLNIPLQVLKFFYR